MNTIDSILNNIVLSSFETCCGGTDIEPGDLELAKQDIKADILEIIGEDEQPVWESDHGFCNRCDWQPVDGSRTCLCKVRNRLRQELRTKLKEYFGE